MSKVKVPSKDLPDNVVYQVAEAGLMKEADYDTILDKGWPEFFTEFMQTRVLDDVAPAQLPENQPFDAKFSRGTPDDVYNYSMKLIKGLGPEGFILHSGCDIPANAKLESVKAMISAATGK